MSTVRRGFTLIELLVVIAIIGLLSSVVLASLNTARKKGADASVQSNLMNARAQAALFYDATEGIATSMCANTSVAGVSTIYNHVLAAAKATGLATFARDTAASGHTTAVCNDTTTDWAVEVPLSTSGWFCVDSSGFAGKVTATRINGNTDVSCAS